MRWNSEERDAVDFFGRGIVWLLRAESFNQDLKNWTWVTLGSNKMEQRPTQLKSIDGYFGWLFPDYLISIRGDLECPACFPDLAPCHFFCGGLWNALAMSIVLGPTGHKSQHAGRNCQHPLTCWQGLCETQVIECIDNRGVTYQVLFITWTRKLQDLYLHCNK